MITYGTFSPVCVWSEKSNQTECAFGEGRGRGPLESKQQLYPDLFLTLPNACGVTESNNFLKQKELFCFQTPTR